MRKTIHRHLCFRNVAAVLALILFYSVTIAAQSLAPTERTIRYFDSVRVSPAQLFAFLLKMPKGADLHNHLSGAIYAESYIHWAAASGDCVNTTTMVASLPPCTTGQVPAANALANSVLFQQIIDAWSMQNWQLSGESGHDHFFNTFGKFGFAAYAIVRETEQVIERDCHSERSEEPT